MSADRQNKKCQPRTVRRFQKQLTELKNRIGFPQPPTSFEEDWFAGLCAEPSQFTEQLVKLRESLQVSLEPEAHPEPQQKTQATLGGTAFRP